MTRAYKLGLGAAVSMVAVTMFAAPAAAQQSDCSAGDLRPIADGWLPTSVGLSLAEKACTARDFLRRAFTSEEDPADITPAHVLEASRPQLDPAQQHARDEFLAAEKIKLREQREYSEFMHRNMANEAVTAALEREQAIRKTGIEITEPFQKWPEGYDVIPSSEPGGMPTLVQSANPGGQNLIIVSGEAIVLGPDGVQAGTFKGGQLEGTGEKIEPSGAWREGGFKRGQMEGPGLEVGRGDDGKPVLTTGDFESDFPDGQVTVTYAGGGRRSQLWEDGQLVSQGPLAAPGATLASAPKPRATSAMGAYESALEYEMVPAREGGKLDGSFESNGQPVGEMIRYYPDGTSQRELWEGGKVIGRGALSRLGGVPPRIDRIYRPQLPPRSAWKPAVAPRPAPPPVAITSSGGYSSVCTRNESKLSSFIFNMGGIEWSARVYGDYMRMWAQCRGSDPRAEAQYQEHAEYYNNQVSIGKLDSSHPNTIAFMNELSRAISDPNYSSELGPVRGGPGAGASGGGGGGSRDGSGQSGATADGPAPGTSVGTFEVADPLLPSSFQARYSGIGLSPDTISQQLASDAELNRIQDRLDSTRDTITRLRLLIAKLEGMIVIQRQSQDFPGERQRIQGMIDSRDAALNNCRNIASTPSICTAPLR